MHFKLNNSNIIPGIYNSLTLSFMLEQLQDFWGKEYFLVKWLNNSQEVICPPR